MRPPRAIVKITRYVVQISCPFEETKLLLDPDLDLRPQIDACSFTHQRRCGRCDTSQASVDRLQGSEDE